MPQISVSQLNIYPLKSAKGLSVQELQLGKIGPEYDRRWMVVDKNNRFITQRQHPKMCLITTHLNKGQLTLCAPNMAPINLIADNNKTVLAGLWKDEVNGHDCGNEAARWMSDYLGIQCRLIFMPDHVKRLVDTQYAKQKELVGYADGFPILLISQASLDHLNSKLNKPIGMNRFRPNIVVTGCDTHAEDNWKSIAIAGIEFSLVKPCSRCIIPSIDPNTGIKQPEVIKTLASYRRHERAVYFGQNLIYSGLGNIKVGDKIDVIS